MSYLMNADIGGVQLYTSRRLGNLTHVFTVKVIFPFKIKLCFESDVYFLSEHERISPTGDGYKVGFFLSSCIKSSLELQEVVSHTWKIFISHENLNPPFNG